MEQTAQAVEGRCKELEKYWSARNRKMKDWYRLIEMVDELKTDKMESFVGNDPRAMFNLVTHLLDAPIPHRLDIEDLGDMELANISSSVSKLLGTAWNDNAKRFRRSGPHQSLSRYSIGLMLATGWYAEIALLSDDGKSIYFEPLHPAQVYPMWDYEQGLSEVAHIYTISSSSAKRMCSRNNWTVEIRGLSDITIYDYWWVEYEVLGQPLICNAVSIGGTLVKYEPTHLRRIPIYTGPVGGLPDSGILSNQILTSSNSVGSPADTWKAEIGQSIVATNENIYRSWNKWWTFSMQLLRDTAQPRIFERSRSGKAIVKPEDVFRRGAIFRGGPDDSVDFIGSPPIPLELRSTQLDLEAMMQRGGVSWAMFGNATGQLTAYVMSQIAASANQIMRPFHQAIINKTEDEDNDILQDILSRGASPYNWKIPEGLTSEMRVVADYDIEIPGDLIQRATVARMIDPDFRLSYSYVLQHLFPDIKNSMEERARVRADIAERHPTNSMIALIQYYRIQAAFLTKNGDTESARLYDLAADLAESQISPQQPQQTGQPNLPTNTGTPAVSPRFQLPQNASSEVM